MKITLVVLRSLSLVAFCMRMFNPKEDLQDLQHRPELKSVYSLHRPRVDLQLGLSSLSVKIPYYVFFSLGFVPCEWTALFHSSASSPFALVFQGFASGLASSLELSLRVVN